MNHMDRRNRVITQLPIVNFIAPDSHWYGRVSGESAQRVQCRSTVLSTHTQAILRLGHTHDDTDEHCSAINNRQEKHPKRRQPVAQH